VKSTPIDDDRRIKHLLIGDETELAAGLSEVDTIYRYKVGGLLRKRLSVLASEDLPEIWQDTLVSLFLLAKRRKLNLDKDLGGLIWTLARRRAYDQMRRNASWQLPIDSMMQHLFESPQSGNSPPGRTLDLSEIIDLVCQTIDRLPPRQRLVWRVYVDHYPDSQKLGYLTEQVRRYLESTSVGGDGEAQERLTLKAVASALDRGRQRIREAIRKKGYSP
jgi:RNA polymerase sigma factor (sigma-70 family)